MRKIFFPIYFIVVMITIISCRNRGPEYQYLNVDCKIVSMGQESKLTDDKFHNPELVKVVLIQLVEDTTKFCELVSNDDRISNEYARNQGYLTALTPEWFYNHKVGDIIHFDYIAKRRFFNIKNSEIE